MSNFLILPLVSGEVTLQYYNTVLSLSEIYQYSDVIFILTNDNASKICSSLFGKKKISFSKINNIISMKIARVLAVAPNKISQINTNNFSEIKSNENDHQELNSNLANPFMKLFLKMKNKESIFNMIKEIKKQLIKENKYKILGIRFFPMISPEHKSFEQNSWNSLFSRSFRSLISSSV